MERGRVIADPSSPFESKVAIKEGEKLLEVADILERDKLELKFFQEDAEAASELEWLETGRIETSSLVGVADRMFEFDIAVDDEADALSSEN